MNSKSCVRYIYLYKHYTMEIQTIFSPPERSLIPICCKLLPSQANAVIEMLLVLLISSTSSDFPSGSDGKASTYNMADLGQIPGSGRFHGEGNGNPLQYSCLENPMDRGAWQVPVHGVAQSGIQLSNFTFTFTSSVILCK